MSANTVQADVNTMVHEHPHLYQDQEADTGGHNSLLVPYIMEIEFTTTGAPSEAYVYRYT